MIIAFPPFAPPFEVSQPSVFLAGSIEMGTAEDWQTKVCNVLADKNVLVLNPRRGDWDASWEQSTSNQQFSAQVNWELDMLELADRVIVYFDKNTKSPISLMELGLFADSGKVVVCCPDGFWRKGNVEIVCQRYDIPMFHTFESLLMYIGEWKYD